MRPHALVVRAPGTNRDPDVSYALQLAGADTTTILVAEFGGAPEILRRSQILVLAGGFSYADALGAGRMIALDIRQRLIDEMQSFVDDGNLIVGICNGFQALVASGLLPGDRPAALAPNASGRFECSWVRLTAPTSKSIWTNGLDDIECPIAHGEGRFVADADTLAVLAEDGRIALRYSGRNPNGSSDDIAGVCDPTGRILGLMPHPENHVVDRQHPKFGRGHRGGLGLAMFRRGVEYAEGR